MRILNSPSAHGRNGGSRGAMLQLLRTAKMRRKPIGQDPQRVSELRVRKG